MDDSRLQQWAAHFETLANRALSDTDPDAAVADALQQHESLLAPVIAHVTGRRITRPTITLPDVRLWWDVVDGCVDASAIIDVDGDGALFEQGAFTTIEVWTETELAALHALGHVNDDSRVRSRVERTIAWHLDNTQPDNATNHPWAIHLFLTHGSSEGVHLAEMQLNSCQVMNVNPDPMSAWILRDAAAWLRLKTSTP